MTALPAATSAAAQAPGNRHRNTIIEVSAGSSAQLSAVDSPYLAHGGDAFQAAAGAVAPVFSPRLEDPGYYRIYAWWPRVRPDGPRQARYRVATPGTADDIKVDQQHFYGQWVFLGEFAAGGGQELSLQVTGEAVLLDAFRFEYVGPTPSDNAIVTDNVPVATQGREYRGRLQLLRGREEGQWVINGALPRGIKLLAEDGQLVGVPVEAGIFSFDVMFIDAAGAATVTDTVELAVVPAGAARAEDAKPQRKAEAVSLQLSPALNDATPSDSLTLLDQVAAMPEGSWQRMNLNAFSDVWAPAQLRPLYGLSNPPPSRIIAAWSSFAWDHDNGRLIIYGGGHANYNGNDVYIWRGDTRRWERGSLPSEVTQDDAGNWIAVDGAFAAPSSAHTYDNNVYLPNAGRFMTYGGAAFNNGGAYKRLLESGSVVSTGPYLFDPAKADPDSVGGSAGSHVQREGPFPEISGGEMWQNRDLYNLPASPGPLPSQFVNGTSHATSEQGADVVYLTAASGGGTAQQLYKHTIPDVSSPALDSLEIVGRYWEGFGGPGAGAYSPASNVYVRTANSTLVYWDLRQPGPDNRNRRFMPADTTGEFELSYGMGLDYAAFNEAFYLWGGGGQVWKLDPPTPVTASGWVITKENPGGTETPQDGYGTGILGKWEFARDLNVFVALQDATAGNVWVYKPRGWVSPVQRNRVPVVSLLSPVDSTVISPQEPLLLEASASDPDGEIALLRFLVDGAVVHETTEAPYRFEWTSAVESTYRIEAAAVDNEQAVSVSPAVSVVVAPDNIPPELTLDSPAPDSSFVEGESVSLAASASDADGTVSRVEFFANGGLIGEAAAPPFTLSWTAAAAGSYQLSAVAIDDDDDRSAAASVTVEVLSSNQAPGVQLSSPAPGSRYTLGATLALAADATDPDGTVSRVEFLANGSRIGEDTAPPFTLSWTPAAPGSYELSARATDDDDASRVSAPVAIEVAEANGSLSVTLQDGLNGYAGTRDAYLSVWHRAFNYGSSERLRDRSGTYTSLLRFAIFQSEGGPVPDGASIESATLSLYKYSSYDHVYELNRLLRPWVEEEVTWLQRQAGQLWEVPGAAGAGDRAAQPAAGAVTDWPPGWLDLDVTDSVQRMSLGTGNHGWRLQGVSGNGNTRNYYSREHSANPQLRPRLTISYGSGGNLPPQVVLDSPAPDSSVAEGDSVTLAASASDPDGSVSRVEFSANGSLIGEDTAAPFTLAWTAESAGSYQLSAVAIDDDGDRSAAVSVTVDVLSSNTGPSVQLTSPGAGSSYRLGDTLALAADATDPDGSVSRVEFFANGSRIGEDTAAPFTLAWTPVTPGAFELTALATDDDNATALSAPVATQVTDPGGSPGVTLQDGLDGYAGTRDAYLSTWYRSRNYGTGETLLDRADTYTGLVQFAIFQSEGGPVPDGATIESATLSLYKYSSYDHVYELHRLLRPWVEEEVSWLQSRAGEPWETANAAGASDRAAEPAAEAATDWPPGWLDLDVTDSVQRMSLGTGNHGWRLQGVSGNGNTRRFYSRENSSYPQRRPKLTISYRFGGNLPPQVALDSPAPGAGFVEGDRVSLAASASDPDGTVQKVEFFANGSRIGEDTAPPFTLSWTPAAPGSYELSARATDDDDASRVSAPVAIEVAEANGSLSVTLQDGLNGYAGTRDAYLSVWHRAFNYGSSERLRDRSGTYTSLLRFAIFQSEGGPVPDGASIESATLSLYKYSSYDHVYELNRLLRPWVEEEVTWLQRQAGQLWEVPGAAGAGDRAAQPAAGAVTDWPPGWLDLDVTDSVRRMSLGTGNHGWRLQGVGGNGNTKSYYSRENTDFPQYRPRLIVEYRPGG